ncbi:MEDS domain-containing protein [Natroniella sulfidigena]|uniref:MEDS domain-containing protein n=1 Tax=Natroniella sulfidigena TaxID=723921 RepID=UPI00200A9859|nr:MEDS domain-containing protein [Natroniella sulfidigena]MCK8816811.1 MEDS domain-containing protein [Natroniella sulfidigena]
MSLDEGNRHVCSLYYGKEHFLVKAVHFLNQGLQEGEKVFFYVEDDLKEQVLEAIDQQYQHSDQIEFISDLDLIEIYSQFGKEALQEELKTLSSGKFTKIRSLYQVSKAVKEVGQKAVLDLEQVMNEALEGSNLLVLCMYDVTDVIENDSLKPWLEQALSQHQCLLNGGEYLNLTASGLAV